jgi:Cu2+-exporting ATPase
MAMPGWPDILAAFPARLGFRVAPWSPACLKAEEDSEGRALLGALGIATFGAMNVMGLSVAVWVGSDMAEGTRALMHWLSALVALPPVLVAGMPSTVPPGRPSARAGPIWTWRSPWAYWRPPP